MKKLLPLLLILILFGCTNKNLLKVEDMEEIKYLKLNRDKLVSVQVRKTTIGSNDCYDVDIEEGYKAITNMSIKKESPVSVTDDYMYYTFTFEDGTSKVFHFDGGFLYYNKISYVLENFDEAETREEDIVECVY